MLKHFVLLLFYFAALLALGGCSPERIPFVYKIDVPQGNLVTKEQVAKLKIGMSPEQVSFLLGTPLLIDPFHQNQWDYVYIFTPGSIKQREGLRGTEQLLRVYFQQNRVCAFRLLNRTH